MMNYLLRELVRKNLEKFFAPVSKDFKVVRTLGLDDDSDPIFEVGNNTYLCFFNSDSTEITARLLATNFRETDTEHTEGFVFVFNKEDDTLTLKKFFIHLSAESQDVYFVDIPEEKIQAGTIRYHRSCPKGGCTFESSTLDLKSKVPEVQTWIEEQLKALA